MIYICIPAHNEERTVGVLLWKVRQVMASFPRDYQILVANDGSTDGTAEVLSPYQRILPLTVVQIEQRRGYATALELLVREAVRRAEYPKRDVVVTLQADFTDDPAELQGLLKRVEAGADIVVANAKVAETAGRAARWGRRLGNLLLRRRGWPEGVSDALCGLRAYRVIVLKRALEANGEHRLLTWDGWVANAELLRVAQAHSRRTDVVEYTIRSDRQQRASRQALWPVIQSIFHYARGTTGPLTGHALPATSMIDLRDRRRSNRAATQNVDAQPDSQRSQGRASGATADRGRSGERRAERSGPGKKTAKGPRPGKANQAATDERPARERRTRQRDRSAPRSARAAAPQNTAGPAGNGAAPGPVTEEPEARVLNEQGAPAKRKRRRKRRGGARRGPRPETPQAALEPGVEPVQAPEAEALEPENGEGAPESSLAVPGGVPRKRRSRRGGRGRRGRGRARAGPDTSTKDSGGGEAQSPDPKVTPVDFAPSQDVQPES